MEITNHIIVNMLKRQLLDVYEKYAEQPELLQNVFVKFAFDRLVKVSTVEEFKQWRSDISELNLGFDNVNGIQIQDSVMERLDDIAASADDKSLTEFIIWKRNLTPDSWGQVRMQNRMNVRRIKAALSTGYDAHIVLFRYGKQWAAIGADADRIFELFSWQTGFVNDDDSFISWITINKYGYKVLLESEYSIKVIDIGKVDVVSVAFTEDMLSSAQQFLDYLRYFTAKSERLYHEFCNESALIMDYTDYIRQVNIDNVNITPERISVKLKSGENVTLADGKDWRCDEVGLGLIPALSKLDD